jgi:hypothetical protein
LGTSSTIDGHRRCVWNTRVISCSCLSRTGKRRSPTHQGSGLIGVSLDPCWTNGARRTESIRGCCRDTGDTRLAVKNWPTLVVLLVPSTRVFRSLHAIGNKLDETRILTFGHGQITRNVDSAIISRFAGGNPSGSSWSCRTFTSAPHQAKAYQDHSCKENRVLTKSCEHVVPTFPVYFEQAVIGCQQKGSKGSENVSAVDENLDVVCDARIAGIGWSPRGNVARRIVALGTHINS